MEAALSNAVQLRRTWLSYTAYCGEMRPLQLGAVSTRSTQSLSPRDAIPDHGPAQIALRLRDIFGPFAVVLMLFAGFFKGAPALSSLPFDLTAFAAVLVVVLVIVTWMHNPASVRVSPWLFAPALALAWGFHVPGTSIYAEEMRLKLLVIVVGVTGALLLARSYKAQQVWVWLHVGVGFAMVALVAGGATNDRLGTGVVDTIAAGQAFGVTAVVLVTLILTRGIHRWWHIAIALLITAFVVTQLVGTGSRGAALGAALSVLTVAAVAPHHRRALRILGSIGAIVVGYLLLTRAQDVGAARLQMTVSGELSATSTRSPLWEAAIRFAPGHPAGVGWGNFGHILHMSTQRQYPHNVLLQTLTEGGWFAGLLTAVGIVLAMVRLRRNASHPTGAALLGIAVFFLIASMSSGDLNDNRMMWAAIALGFVVKPPPHPQRLGEGHLFRLSTNRTLGMHSSGVERQSKLFCKHGYGKL